LRTGEGDPTGSWCLIMMKLAIKSYVEGRKHSLARPHNEERENKTVKTVSEWKPRGIMLEANTKEKKD